MNQTITKTDLNQFTGYVALSVMWRSPWNSNHSKGQL